MSAPAIRGAAAARVLDALLDGSTNAYADGMFELHVGVPPPRAWLALQASARSGGAAKAKVHQALAPRAYPVPHFGTTAACRCRITGTSHARRFRSKELNRFLSRLFERLPPAAACAGLPHAPTLSRWDLHHAHLFYAHGHPSPGLLFHAREYPAPCPNLFPVDLGFCQRGSPLAFDPGAQALRNVLWLGGRAACLDVGTRSELGAALLMDGLHEARTVLEADFGPPLADVFYLAELHARKPEHRVFVLLR